MLLAEVLALSAPQVFTAVPISEAALIAYGWMTSSEDITALLHLSNFKF